MSPVFSFCCFSLLVLFLLSCLVYAVYAGVRLQGISERTTEQSEAEAASNMHTIIKTVVVLDRGLRVGVAISTTLSISPLKLGWALLRAALDPAMYYSEHSEIN